MEGLREFSQADIKQGKLAQNMVGVAGSLGRHSASSGAGLVRGLVAGVSQLASMGDSLAAGPAYKLPLVWPAA